MHHHVQFRSLSFFLEFKAFVSEPVCLLWLTGKAKVTYDKAGPLIARIKNYIFMCQSTILLTQLKSIVNAASIELNATLTEK